MKFKSFIVKLRFMCLAFRAIFQLNLGDEVVYKGFKYYTIQGAADPYWDIYNELVRRDNVHKKDFRKLISWRNIKHDFTYIYNFYMGYWYTICLNYSYKKILGFDCSKSYNSD
jgi:hypothetical protein